MVVIVVCSRMLILDGMRKKKKKKKKKKTRLFDIGYAVLQYAIFIIICDQCRETPIKTQGR